MSGVAVQELTFGLFVDGRWSDGEGNEVISVVNPATEQQIGTTPLGTISDARRALQATWKPAAN